MGSRHRSAVCKDIVLGSVKTKRAERQERRKEGMPHRHVLKCERGVRKTKGF